MQVERLSSRANPLLARLRQLRSDPAGYRRDGRVWIEGEHLCAAFLARGGAVPQAVVTEAGWEQPALHRLASAAQRVAVVPEAVMSTLSALGSPASIGFAVPLPAEPPVQPGRPTVVLDRLQDAGNVGSVLRSAAAFGFTQVLALKGTAALWSPKVLRAGMGAHFGLALIEGLVAPPELDVPLLAASAHAALSLPEATLPWPCAWVLGHEGQGVAPALLRGCAMALRIPQPGGEESLNVAAAAAVCFYESSRRRT